MAYCVWCGTELSPGAAYCHKCGRAVNREGKPDQPVQKQGERPRRRGSGISIVGAATAVLMFFMPWLTSGCVEMSGFDIATAMPALRNADLLKYVTEYKAAFQVGSTMIEVLLWLMFLGALLVLGLALLAFVSRTRRSLLWTGILSICIGAGGIILVLLIFASLIAARRESPLYLWVSFEYGFIMTALALATLIVGGVIGLVDLRGGT
ncbi:MAG: zinc ribbon domain-containing protein [Candidatus Methanomethyliaceae archaeon]